MTDRERTFVMVKPDAFQRGLVGEIIGRIEQRGLKLVGMKLLTPTQEQGEEHYAEHEDKPFYDDLVEFITSGPAVPMVVEGENAVGVVRDMIGATDPAEASPGTVRGDYALDIGHNCVHAADARDTAEREISIYFDEDELESYDRVDETWIYE